MLTILIKCPGSPLDRVAAARMPDLLAITIIIAVAVCIAPPLAVRGFSLVGRSLADAPHYQALYDTLVTWLGGHGFSVAGLWAERPRR